MAKNRITRIADAERVVIIVDRKRAERMAVILESCGDWLGNTEGEELGYTARQFEAGCNDLDQLTEALRGGEPA